MFSKEVSIDCSKKIVKRQAYIESVGWCVCTLYNVYYLLSVYMCVCVCVCLFPDRLRDDQGVQWIRPEVEEHHPHTVQHPVALVLVTISLDVVLLWSVRIYTYRRALAGFVNRA